MRSEEESARDRARHGAGFESDFFFFFFGIYIHTFVIFIC